MSSFERFLNSFTSLIFWFRNIGRSFFFLFKKWALRHEIEKSVHSTAAVAILLSNSPYGWVIYTSWLGYRCHWLLQDRNTIDDVNTISLCQVCRGTTIGLPFIATLNFILSICLRNLFCVFRIMMILTIFIIKFMKNIWLELISTI